MPLLQYNFLHSLQGVLVGDSGYRMGKHRTVAKDRGLTMLARPVDVSDLAFHWKLRQFFKKRRRTETAFAQLKDDLGLRASRSCRCLTTFKTVVFNSLIAYTLGRRFENR